MKKTKQFFGIVGFIHHTILNAVSLRFQITLFYVAAGPRGRQVPVRARRHPTGVGESTGGAGQGQGRPQEVDQSTQLFLQCSWCNKTAKNKCVFVRAPLSGILYS